MVTIINSNNSKYVPMRISYISNYEIYLLLNITKNELNGWGLEMLRVET